MIPRPSHAITPEDIAAVVLTHGHFDHVGLCDRLSHGYGTRIHVHPDDKALVRHPYRYDHEAPRWRSPVLHPRAWPGQLKMAAAGALWVEGSSAKGDITPGAALQVPGRPVPVACPGHTLGHCGFLLAEDGVVFTGDALVTLDPYTGRVGPRLVARAATADVAQNLSALDGLAATGAALVLPGHGRPFDGGIMDAVERARTAPVA